MMWHAFAVVSVEAFKVTDFNKKYNFFYKTTNRELSTELVDLNQAVCKNLTLRNTEKEILSPNLLNLPPITSIPKDITRSTGTYESEFSN